LPASVAMRARGSGQQEAEDATEAFHSGVTLARSARGVQSRKESAGRLPVDRPPPPACGRSTGGRCPRPSCRPDAHDSGKPQGEAAVVPRAGLDRVESHLEDEVRDHGAPAAPYSRVRSTKWSVRRAISASVSPEYALPTVEAVAVVVSNRERVVAEDRLPFAVAGLDHHDDIEGGGGFLQLEPREATPTRGVGLVGFLAMKPSLPRRRAAAKRSPPPSGRRGPASCSAGIGLGPRARQGLESGAPLGKGEAERATRCRSGGGRSRRATGISAPRTIVPLRPEAPSRFREGQSANRCARPVRRRRSQWCRVPGRGSEFGKLIQMRRRCGRARPGRGASSSQDFVVLVRWISTSICRSPDHGLGIGSGLASMNPIG
jgi:hypothetical protein